MPLSPTLLSGAIKFQMAGVGFAGRDMFKLADAIGRAVFIHVSTPNMTLSSLAGTIGPVGTVNNVAPVVGIVPTVMSNLINANGLQSGFVGRDLRKLSQAISFGLSQVLLTMVLNGSAIGVSVGGGSAKFAGRDMFKLATMVSTGVVMHLMSSATFPVVSVGVIAPIPPVGPLPIAAVPTVFSKIS
jgi:hypothetical protein